MYIDREYSDGLEGDYIKYAVFISRRVYTHSFLSFLNVNTFEFVTYTSARIWVTDFLLNF